jgi:hypothetical protein
VLIKAKGEDGGVRLLNDESNLLAHFLQDLCNQAEDAPIQPEWEAWPVTLVS